MGLLVRTPSKNKSPNAIADSIESQGIRCIVIFVTDPVEVRGNGCLVVPFVILVAIGALDRTSVHGDHFTSTPPRKVIRPNFPIVVNRCINKYMTL